MNSDEFRVDDLFRTEERDFARQLSSQQTHGKVSTGDEDLPVAVLLVRGQIFGDYLEHSYPGDSSLNAIAGANEVRTRRHHFGKGNWAS